MRRRVLIPILCSITINLTAQSVEPLPQVFTPNAAELGTETLTKVLGNNVGNQYL